MKKILGLLALMLAVSGSASADQDVLKDIKFSTEVRQGWQDRDGKDANGIGNEGFKKNNRTRTRVRSFISGNLSLNDEWGLNAYFNFKNDNDKLRNKFDGSSITHNGTYSKRDNWYTTLELSKSVKLGSFEVTPTLGWYNETNRRKLNSAGKEDPAGSMKTTGISNDIYFGPSFDFKVFGQNISATLQAVYTDIKKGGSGDYHLSGNDFVKGRAEGWGFNADFSHDKDIYNGKAGKVSYSIGLTHHFRDLKGKVSETGEDAKSNVYIDYYTGISYTTPSFKGFYGKLTVDNEWEKYTAVTGYYNTFSVWTDLGYKTSFDTAVGKVTINPYVKYRPVQRYSEYNKHNENKRVTTEVNELRAGLSVSLATK